MNGSVSLSIEPIGLGAKLVVIDEELAFTDFYHASADGIYRGLALALGNAELAQEALDEAMARAYQRWRKISRYDNPAGWVYRVGLNWARGRLRKYQRESDRPVPEQAAMLNGSDLDLDLQRALARLSLDARTVVVLRYLLEWSTAETASALGIAQGTVKSRLARALGDLELLLEER